MRPCEFHPVKPAKNCRKCRVLGVVEDKGVQQVKLDVEIPKKGRFKVYGNQATFNLSTLMVKNILSSSYYNRRLHELTRLPEVVEEICENCNHIEPWIQGSSNTPSTLFCCLFKALVLKPTEGQLRFMMRHQNAYVKACAYLMVRIAGDPAEYWERMRGGLEDLQEFQWNSKETRTVKEFILKLLGDQAYFSTILPRIPVAIEKEIANRCAGLQVGRKRTWADRSGLFAIDKRLRAETDEVIDPGPIKRRKEQIIHKQEIQAESNVVDQEKLAEIEREYRYEGEGENLEEILQQGAYHKNDSIHSEIIRLG